MLDVNDFKVEIKMFHGSTRDGERRLYEAYRRYTWRGHKVNEDLFNELASLLPDGSQIWVDRETV